MRSQMRSRLAAVFSLLLILFLSGVVVYAQTTDEKPACADTEAPSSRTHRFRKEWESFDVALAGNGECNAVSLELRWANGRNNGSNFNVTFIDANNHPIYTRQLAGFLSGSIEFPLVMSGSVESKPWLGTPWMMATPVSVTVQAVRPFAYPSNISYRVVRIARAGKKAEIKTGPGKSAASKNEVVRIHNAVRLIGARRLELVQIQMETVNPFPVKDVPLRLQIGKRIFLHELSGDFTGRTLTLSLTPEMFAELEDGAEIVAFFNETEAAGARRDVWSFGRLDKGMLNSGDESRVKSEE